MASLYARAHSSLGNTNMRKAYYTIRDRSTQAHAGARRARLGLDERNALPAQSPHAAFDVDVDVAHVVVEQAGPVVVHARAGAARRQRHQPVIGRHPQGAVGRPRQTARAPGQRALARKPPMATVELSDPAIGG